MEENNYFEQGEEQYVKGNYSQALDLFKKQLGIHPSADSMNYIGACYIHLGEFFKAITLFKSLMQAEPDWERPVFNLGRVYFKMGKMEKAYEYYSKALKLNSESEDALFYMGTYFFEVGKYEEAKHYFKRAVKINEAHYESHLSLGMCYFKMEKLELALEEFDKACELSDPDYDALRNKGLVLLDMKNISKALETFILAHATKPNEVEIMIDIIYCNAKMKKYNIAMQWTSKVLELEPENEIAKNFSDKLSVLLQNETID